MLCKACANAATNAVDSRDISVLCGIDTTGDTVGVSGLSAAVTAAAFRSASPVDVATSAKNIKSVKHNLSYKDAREQLAFKARGSYAEAVRRGPPLSRASVETQTSPEDLSSPQGSSYVHPKTVGNPPPSCSNEVVVPSKEGTTPSKEPDVPSPAPAGPSGRGRGLSPRAPGSSSKPGRSDSPLPPKGPKVSLDEKMDDRCDLLIAQFRSQDRTNLRTSGTEEQYVKKGKLLEDISDLARAFGRLPKVLPRRVATSPTGTTDTEGTQAASPGLSAAAQVRAVHAMRDAVTSAAHEEHVAAAADHQVDVNGRPSESRDRPDFVPSVFNYARAPGESTVQSQDPFLERHKAYVFVVRRQTPRTRHVPEPSEVFHLMLRT
ncbi:hypothetical protein HPB47_027547 [Ixodes persulcatus]|uniref:Uncharacterized protein n=1 Tax=Ixodes persulcatus TaxID=34615 RepID=A0AC60PWS7_IXOPE|nr:hypothetical protein HPB47_027547 [Ixodes persulcatus]